MRYNQFFDSVRYLLTVRPMMNTDLCDAANSLTVRAIVDSAAPGVYRVM